MSSFIGQNPPFSELATCDVMDNWYLDEGNVVSEGDFNIVNL